VLPLDVPSAIFDHRAARADALLSQVRKLVFNRSGWALGEPMWIQAEEEVGDLIMQLGEGIGLNLGDSGSLYVFDHSILMQCH
jgi:hypothetical protein